MIITETSDDCHEEQLLLLVLLLLDRDLRLGVLLDLGSILSVISLILLASSSLENLSPLRDVSSSHCDVRVKSRMVVVVLYILEDMLAEISLMSGVHLL